MKISLITATYNREHLLPKLYESIVDNYEDYKDIEWIIVDDGSVDETKSLVNTWIKKSKFDIKYIYQDNQGKMKAINNGMDYVTGDIVIEIDSDDYFKDNIFSSIVKDFKKIDNNVYGILYKIELIGKESEDTSNIDNKVLRLYDVHYKYAYNFDMVLVFKADVRKKYKYKLENNEKFITEARLYYKMDFDYDGLLFKNREIVVSEYMDDGYSNHIQEIFKKYPYGYYEYFKEALSYTYKDVLFNKRLYLIKHFILFGYLTKRKKSELINSVKGFNKILVMLLVIPGYIKAKNF